MLRSLLQFSLLLSVPVLPAGPGSLRAQAADHHAILISPRDSLYQSGLSLLQRAAIEDGRYFDRARDAFRRAHQLDPGWAAPLLGIGLAEGGKGDWLAGEPLNIGTRVGHGAYRSAIRALISAIEKDPHLTAAIIEMDRVALALRDTAIDGQVLGALRRSTTSGNDDPRVLLILGRRERAAGSARAAIDAFTRYAASGRSTSLANYEIARSLLTAGDSQGFSLYLEAAVPDDSATAAELRSDLLPIAEPEELSRYDNSTGNERRDFLIRFWEDRARLDLRSPAERLQEHFRRLRFARTNFILSNNRRYYGLRDLYRASGSETLDDRGVIYVRQGEPDQRLRPVIFGLLPNETWLYRRADGDLLMHFSAGGEHSEGGDLADYRLVSSVFALRGNRTPTDLLIASRIDVSDLYQKIMAWGPSGSRRAMEEERRWGEVSAHVGTSTDGFELKFPSRLEVTTDLVAAGRKGSSTQIHLVYALPQRLGPGSPVRARLAVFDSSGSVVAWLDSTALSEPMGSARSGGRFQLDVAPGPWLYRYSLEVGPAGMVSPRMSILVPSFAASLSMSGVVLGNETGNLSWVRNTADTALVHPGRVFSTNGNVRLYSEVYGMPAGALFTTSVVVSERTGNRSGRQRMRFSFIEEGRGDVTPLQRSFRLDGLREGDYWIEVVAEDGEGRQVISRKGFSIITFHNETQR